MNNTSTVTKRLFEDEEERDKAFLVGAKTKEEYELVQALQVSSYKKAKNIITDMVGRGFIPCYYEGHNITKAYERYLEAESYGVKYSSQLELIEKYNADSYELAKKINKGGFPDSESYFTAQELGMKKYAEYQTHVEQERAKKSLLTSLMTKSDYISKDELGNLLGFKKTIDLLNWLLDLPAEYPIKLDHDNVYFQQDLKQLSVSTSSKEDSTITCPNCSEVIKLTAKYCSECGQAIPRCQICKGIVLEEEVSCEHCQQLFHKQHWLEYYKVKGECPICKK